MFVRSAGYRFEDRHDDRVRMIVNVNHETLLVYTRVLFFFNLKA